MTPDSNRRVFLSYAHDNLEVVWKVYDGLVKRKVHVWFDKVDMGTGKWLPQIMKAIPRSRYFLICMSEAALKKTGDESPGFQDTELNRAYEIAMAQQESTFTIVPVRLEDCDRGDNRITAYQQYNIFEDFEAGLDKLAVNLEGISLADKHAEDTRTEDEKIVENLKGIADASFYARKFHKAFDTYNQLTTLTPEDANAWCGKAKLFSCLERHEEALEAFDKAIAIKPDYVDAWYNKGGVLRILDRIEEALEAYNKTIEIKPDHAHAWNDKGCVLYDLGKKEEALEACDKAIEINPNDVNPWISKSFILDPLDRIEKYWRNTLDRNPDSASAWTSQGNAISSNLGMHQKALKFYDKAIEINPNYARAWYNKSYAFRVLGMHEEAEKCLEKYEELSSKQ